MIGSCPITGVRLWLTVQLQLYRLITANTAVYAPSHLKKLYLLYDYELR